MRGSERKFVESVTDIFTSMKEGKERDVGKIRVRMSAVRTNYPIQFRKFFGFGNNTNLETSGFKNDKRCRLI